jgi:hypothetical protein
LTYFQKESATPQEEEPANPKEKSTALSQDEPTPDQKESRKSLSQILDYVRSKGWGKHEFSSVWNRYYLQEDDYAELLAKIAEESESVQGFFKYKVKYVPQNFSLLSTRQNINSNLLT